MRRDLLIAAAAGVLSGLLLVAAWQGSVVGVTLGLMFSAMPLAMVALGLGLVALPVAAIGGAVAVAVATSSVVLAAIYVVSDAVPVAIVMWTVARRASETAPIGGRALGQTVAVLALAAVVLMTAVLASVTAGPEGLQATLRAQLDAMMAEMPTTAPSNSALTPEALMDAVARILPGTAAWSWSFRALIGAALGQYLLARDGFARWPTPAYRTIAVPGWYIGAFAAAGIASWLASGDAGYVAANAALGLSFPLVLQGLAVVHTAIAKLGFGRMGVIVFYGMALVAAGAVLVLIAIIGVMEHFLQLRARLMPGPRDGGK